MGLLKRLKGMGFDWDTSDLNNDYIDETIQQQLLVQAVTGAPSMDLMRIETGIKHKKELQTLDLDVTYQDASDCGLETEGDVDLGKYEMAVSTIGQKKRFCEKDLANTEFNQILTAGAMAEDKDIPAQLQSAIINLMVNKMKYENEKLIWRGDSSLSTGNLSFFDGFKTKFDASGAVVELNTEGYTEITNANAFDAFYSFVDAFESNIGEGIIDEGRLVLFADRKSWRRLSKNMIDLNFFVDFVDKDRYTIRIDGTDILVKATPGLSVLGETNIYAGDSSHFTVGTDLESDMEELEVWYSQDDDVIYFRNKFRLGVNVPFLDNIGKVTLASS